MKPLNSASYGAMGSLLKKLHEQMHTEDEAQQLRSDLGTISTKMEKLAEVHEPILTVKYWMSDARKLSYDLEVWVDQFVNASNPDAKKAFLAKIIGFEKHVKELNERCDGYNLVSKYVLSSPTNNILVSHDLSTLHAEPEIAISVSIQGIEDPTNKLLEWVKPKEQGEDNPQLMVIPILGADGVGKTTLAKQLWRESLEGKFECRAFVRTAKKSDTRMILRSILSQVRAKQPSAASKVPNLIHDLREHLQGKRNRRGLLP